MEIDMDLGGWLSSNMSDERREREGRHQTGFFFEKYYVHNIFTIFLQQIIGGRLLLVIIVGAKK